MSKACHLFYLVLTLKKLTMSTPRLLHNLHTMSLVKAAPGGLKDCKCKKMALRKCPLIPHVPEKDSVQETVSAYKDNHIKMLINEGTELQFPIWHTGMCKAFSFMLDLPKKGSRKKGILSLMRNIPELSPKSAIRSSS